jgi:3-deoxy-D-manno-octulosonate 8-phosphate phosphatase (KDO 8-P phosphatase)
MDNTARARKITCLVFDVDGTLTDGRIYMGPSGEACKAFDAKDGLAIKLAGRLGYKTALLTGRTGLIVKARAEEMEISEIRQGAIDKGPAIGEICQKFAITPENVAYMGDDLNDLAPMRLVGLACAPRDAAQAVKEAAHFVSGQDGGRGAAREAVEFILKAQGKWEAGVALLSKAK